MTDSNFELHRKEGYGLFRFGTTIAENRKYTDIYGELRERNLYPSDKTWDFMLKIVFKGDKHELEKVKIDALPKKELHQMNFGKYINLLFKRDSLIEISINRGKLNLFLNGHDLFAMEGKEMTHYVAHLLKENPYIDNDDIYFRDHYMMIFGYTAGVENGNVNWLPYNPKDPNEMRSIVIYDGPRRENEDFTNRFIYKVI